MKPLPHIITDDEFFFATEEQRQEWNARLAAGAEADLCVTAPLNLPSFKPLDMLCTWAEYDAASAEQQRDWDERLLKSWDERRQRELAADDEADRQRGSWGE